MSGQPVLLLGVPTEPPLQLVARRLDELDTPHMVWNQRSVSTTALEMKVRDGTPSGRLTVNGITVALEDYAGIFLRLADPSEQPELMGLPHDDPHRQHADRVNELLLTWCELSPARIVNRLRPMMSNASKPHQLRLIADFFAVPDTLVSNDPEEVLAFWEMHGRVVYKSVSGVRSIVHELQEDDLPRLVHLRWCPTQFQEYIDGLDVRVHTIASGCLFATVVGSDAVDYRYAHHGGGTTAMEAMSLPDDVAHSCLQLAAHLGLDFAGLDLKVSEDGRVICLEVNPSPAYSAFESETGQPISRALAAYLGGIPLPP